MLHFIDTGTDIIDYSPRTKEYTYQADHMFKEGSRTGIDLTIKVKQGAKSKSFRFKGKV